MQLGLTHRHIIHCVFTLAFCIFLQQVSSQDNQPPTFSHNEYIFTVYENAAIGIEPTPEIPTTGIMASDTEPITFHKVDPASSLDISLNISTGILTVADNLDRETMSSYTFDIYADDGQRGGKALPIVSVQVVVLDVNDNVPQFINEPYSYTIEEGVSNKHQVNPADGKISVTDKDIGNNKVSIFSLESGHDNKFAIYQNGIITTTLDDSTGVNKIIDFETTDEYNIVVRATNIENGPNGTVFSETNVVVTVSNINDEDPIFQTLSRDQTIAILETTTGIVTTINAIDTDGILPVSTTFTYSIVHANNLIDDLHSFVIDPSSGGVSVAGSGLDHETHEDYVLIIQAEENEFPQSSVLTSLTITIMDVNEYPPVFTPPTYEATISEASDVNSAVLLVSAEDSEPAHTVTYVLDGTANSSTFSINSANGLLVLFASLDRETQVSYTFYVIAADDDPSPMSASAKIVINVYDENDNSPIFTDSEQNTDVDEKITTLPHILYDVASLNMVTDADIGLNNEVKYSFQTGDSSFSIDPDSGVISVVAVLDYNLKSQYELTIIATDQALIASERRTGSFVLTIIVNDLNDNSPVLESIGTQTIEENLPARSIVFTIIATDLDDGLDISLSFSTLASTLPFTINITGNSTSTYISAEVVTTRSLDFETTSDKSFALNITVSDGSNTASEIVVVTAEDVNDNSPIFSQPTGYSFNASEVETGTIIGSVSATDLDTSIFAPITYEKAGDNEDYFKLDTNTGDISIQVGLDAESYPTYRFSIVAFDSGLPPLSNIVIVNVTVNDINDNAPIFLISYVEVSIDENTPVTNIFTFQSIDNDISSPNNMVKYFIVDSFPIVSNLNSLFVIGEDSGILQTGTSQPIRSDFTEIVLTIEARDSGSPVMTAAAIITVLINDLNDNTPTFEFPSYLVNVDEDFSTSETLLQVQAFENPEDANTQIIYSLQVNSATIGNPLPFVTIDSGTGVITAAKSLDFETLALLILTITASDGILQSSASLSITIENINDNTPTLSILVSSCSQSIMEDILLGDTICVLNVMDADQVAQNTEFSLEAGGFSISPSVTEFRILYTDGATTANLILVSILDFESVKSYPLFITIVDRGRPSTRSATLSLPLTVIGVNEHAPVFSLPQYTFYMDEVEEIGSLIGKVTATDADDYSTSDGVFSYTLVGSFPFTLDSSSGLITLNTKVDYEQVNEFQFIVHATDNAGGTQLTGTTTVTVFVEDTNEHPPVFMLFTPPMISEDIAVNEIVLQVAALDGDIDDVISYSIIEGNNDGVFRIDAISGKIFTTNVSPDFEVYSSYNLIVLAADNATNPREASIAVLITIIDVNDNSPVFDRPPIDSFVDESMDSFIMLVSATDLDSTTNAQLTYSVDLTTEFNMGSITGILTTNVPLDRETISTYSPRICATDGGSPFLSVCQLVTITIVDENDNTPVFAASSIITVDVPENNNGGQVVSTFTVTDEDENPTFFFTLLDDGGPFSISSSGNTATVTISGDSTFTPLDRETIDLYTLTVTVTDGDASHTSSHVFDVVVVDVNDQIPFIEKDTYIVSTPLPEDSIDGTIVIHIVAIDDDIFPNNVISFSLLESAEDRFRVDSAGNIIVNIQSGGSILDYEFSTSHTVIVESSDDTLTDTAIIYIPVGDVNDNKPIFLESSYSIGVLETTVIGTTILAVQAIDADSSTNGIVKYSIDPPDGTFSLDETSGVLTTLLTLDAELGPTEYIFRIIAEDSSSTLVLSCLVPVTITVIPQIEDIPVFSLTVYPGMVDEESTVANIVVISAAANDSTVVISYDIVDPAAKFYFSVGPSDGNISLINPLDREEFEDFTFTVVASDGEAFPRRGFSTVKISIIDINDNPPIFLLSLYSVIISEATTGTIITTSATDSDATVNFNTIKYGFSDAGFPFSIDVSTGEISVSGSLDFDEGPKSYSISIFASDDSLTGVTNLNIQITDVNDIAPVITNTDFSLTIPESTPGGTEVFDVNIQDIDTIGTITYQITSGNTDSSFIIDSSGVVTVSAVGLDFETLPTFILGIQVSDGSQMTSSTLMITISDVNDNIPTFDQPQYTVSISEDNSINTEVLSFTVDDLDTGDDGVISVFIDSASNIVNMFKLERTPPNSFRILSALPLDRETSGLSIDNSFGSAKWILKIFAYDNNLIVSNRLTSTAEVLITLLDVNDNQPLFVSSSFSAQISESSNIGTLVISLAATDLDFGTNAEVRYQIPVGSLNEVSFTLDAITGVLKTAAVLSRENNAVLVLQVEATDGTLADTAFVKITITDINDHNPEFNLNIVTASVPENSLAGTSVALVSASDSDDGDNGRISIFIIGGDPRSQFKVNDDNSAAVEIQVAKNDLDRETQSSYELILAARDHGTPTRQGTSTVTIAITDINDNSPVFFPSQYFGTILEDATGGSFVELNTPISVSDVDDGVNSQVTLTLDVNVVFSILPSRVVSLNMNNGLDRELEPSYEIHIVAIDMGNPPLTSSATLSISIGDVNDNMPIFIQIPYSASLAEDVSIGTPVLTVIADDIDSGANMEVTYRVFSNSQGNFEVDLVSGLIKTTSSLDREQTDMYNLVIVAFDSGSPFMSSTATVSIAILDVNDNIPIFSQSLYTGDVDENDPGSIVVILDASDLDLNLNSVLFFDYQDPIFGSTLPFTINSGSGEISVNGILNRESIDMYHFLVVVHDSAVSNQLTATSDVIISINDLNDVAPFFSGVISLRTSLQETTPITTIILSPTATDPDLGDGGDILYSISPSSTIFSVDQTTGEIQLVQSLDVDSTGPNSLSEHQFNLIATDKGIPPLSGTIPVIITVLNENDNVPIFDLSLYTVSIKEDIDMGTIIITLIATDNDTSGTIKYDIVGGNLDLLFAIDEDTGEVSTTLPLLSLSSDIFDLTVRAYESGDNTKSSLTSLHIEISDTNDNAPSFCQTADYRFSVLENSPFSTQVGQICGTDKDTGINGEFTFTISTGNDNDAFDIDQIAGSSTAYIIVKNDVLDREEDDEFVLVLFITDNGSPQLQSLPILAIISILDVNDGIPVLLNLPFTIDLPEDTFGGVIIYQVNGSDSDISLNADIFFEIIDGNIGNIFRIETETGQISLIDSLDFNMQSTYTLTIQVSDKGAVALFAQSTIVITIIDVNNHAPEFMPPYFQSISEDLMISFVISVLAEDMDATTNAELFYSISSGVNSIHFAIDNTNGDIYLNTTLDRETQSSYNLEVTACDMGVPIMCNSVGVIIQILDTNDHEPIFNQPVYSFTVLEDSSADFKIGKVIASDLDDGVNGDIQFSVVVANSLFEIDSDSGDIFVQGKLDRESTDFYQLTIRVEDNGNPALSTFATVNITVLDVNDNSPVIDISQFSSQINEDAATGLLVFDVDATDLDEGTNSKITLSILGGDFGDFFIISDSGKVHVNASLSAERVISYELLIQASDSSDPPLTDIETLIITIIDVNEFPPVFEQNLYYVNLLEDSSLGSVITSVTAIDNDVQGTVNSKISYFIPLPYSTNFSIDIVTGLVKSKVFFNREDSSSLELIVIASNSDTIPILQGSAKIQITLIDINDETPYFINLPSNIQISELSSIGFIVLVLEAYDADDPNIGNGRVSFSSASENSAEFDRSFYINSNGFIEVNGILDKEIQEVYTAVVVVQDEGSPSLSSDAQIVINLLDENDSPPLFTNSVYTISYSEDLDSSSQNGLSRLLLTLNFTDGDSNTENQQSTYKLAANSPSSIPEFSVTDGGEVFVNIGLDREIRDTYTLFIEVVNLALGLGSFCNPFDPTRALLDGSECRLYSNATIFITITDINDNSPVFSLSPYYFAIMDTALFNSEVGFIQALDSDLSVFGQVLYSLTGTSDFIIDVNTGLIKTNVIFSGRLGQILIFSVIASDQLDVSPKSSSETIFVSVLDFQFLVQIVVDQTIDKTQLCLSQLVSKLIEITGFQIHVFEIREHLVDLIVLPSQTDVLIYGFQQLGDSFSLVSQTELIRKIDENFDDLANICDGKVDRISLVPSPSVAERESSNIQIILIIIVCLILLFCGLCANFLALYQRILGKRSIQRTEEYIYGGMEGLDVLTTTQHGALNPNLYLSDDVQLNEELTYESQELKMDLFLDEIPEDEYISASDVATSVNGGSLLGTALEIPTHDDLDISISSI